MGGKQGRQLNPSNMKQLREQVDFSEKEICTWYSEYRNSLRDGHTELTKREFMDVYNSLFVGDASAFAEQVFRSFDKNKDGTVNFQEFLVGLCVSGSSNQETKLKWAFTVYDINGDGYITRSEMLHIIEAIFRMTNHTGTPETLTEQLFTEIDCDMDGKIFWEEFKQGATHNPTIVDLLQVDPTVEES